jgi:DNA replication protein DnaC
LEEFRGKKQQRVANHLHKKIFQSPMLYLRALANTFHFLIYKWLASALGHQACILGFKAAYFNTQKLMLKTKMARLEGTVMKFFDKLAKTDLLIIDDFGLTHLEQQQRIDLMEMIEDRHGKKSTIIVSQLPVSSWYDIIGEETIADAILDRLVHSSYRIELKGESLRKKM